MIKPDLIEKLALEFPHLQRKTIAVAVDVMFEEIVVGLESGKDVKLHNFGVFYTYKRKMPFLAWLQHLNLPTEITVIKFRGSRRLTHPWDWIPE